MVGRRANQLATGLTLMFFGFGLSALIGRPFVGTLIAGLPKLRLLGLGSMGNPLTAYDVLVYLAVPTAVLIWWLLFRTTWGLGLRAVGESPVAAVAAGLSPGRLQYQALAIAGTARRNCRSAPFPVADTDLGGRHDGRPRLHRHRAGDFRQVESALGHCRRALVRRR